jgi:formylglycine-generating enzyme required for sulfatase activity
MGCGLQSNPSHRRSCDHYGHCNLFTYARSLFYFWWGNGGNVKIFKKIHKIIKLIADFIDPLPGKLTFLLAFAILLIPYLGKFGIFIPTSFIPLVYIVVIGAMLLSFILAVIKLQKKKPAGSIDYLAARDKYLRSIIQDCNTLRLVGIDQNASDPNKGHMSLENLYVDLDTTTPLNREVNHGVLMGINDAEHMSVLNVLATCNNNCMVLLGLPGTGKSTFIRYLALKMAKAILENEKLPQEWSGLPKIPVIISLGKFAETILSSTQHGTAEMLEEYIATSLISDERSTEFSEFIFSAALHDGALFLFDGLDEVADIHLRPIVIQAIEDFTQKYNINHMSHFLVSCRTYSYLHDATWKLTGWETHELALLVRSKIKNFIQAWYEELIKIEPARIEEFIKKRDKLLVTIQPNDRRHLLEIAAFPIILTVMAVVHTHYGDLPDTRAQVYERCVDLLLINWQCERSIDGKKKKQNILEAMNLSGKNELYQAVWEVAYEAHGSSRNNDTSLVTEELLDAKLNVYLMRDHKKVDIFLEYCKSANGLLMLQGTVSKPNEVPRNVYTFPHLTFEEYLAARYLANQPPDQYVYEKAGQSDRWSEVIKFLGEHLCFGSQDYPRMDALLNALSNPPIHANAEEKARMTWLAGELLVLYRRGFPSREANADEKIFNQLRITAISSLSDPRIRANCADLADELGYVPGDLFNFALIPNAQNPEFMIAYYPVTNAQYERFLKPENFSNPLLWINFPKYSAPDKKEKITRIGDTDDEGWRWLQQAIKEQKDTENEDILYPRYWHYADFGVRRTNAPVVGISWWEANAYCRWLGENLDKVAEGQQGLLKPREIRLPTEFEWDLAAGGDAERRFPWGKMRKKKEIIHYANTAESRIGRTTPVWMYPKGESQPYQLMDMTGNGWEWQANLESRGSDFIVLRGGSWYSNEDETLVADRSGSHRGYRYLSIGFRVVLFFSSPD